MIGLKIKTCCGLDLYTGGLILGYLRLIWNLIQFINVFSKPSVWSFVLSSISLCICTIWIYGIHFKRARFLLPSVISNIVQLVLSMISAVLVLIFGFVYGPEYFMPHLQPEERINLIKLKYWLTILVFLGMSGIGAIHWFFAALQYSLYIQIKQNFYFRKHRWQQLKKVQKAFSFDQVRLLIIDIGFSLHVISIGNHFAKMHTQGYLICLLQIIANCLTSIFIDNDKVLFWNVCQILCIYGIWKEKGIYMWFEILYNWIAVVGNGIILVSLPILSQQIIEIVVQSSNLQINQIKLGLLLFWLFLMVLNVSYFYSALLINKLYKKIIKKS